MALTEGDKAECKEIAREIIKEVLTEHIAGCPHGIAMRVNKAYIIGVCVGSGIIGSGITLSLAQVIMKGFNGVP